MIITLSKDANVDSVRRELTGAGVWISSTEHGTDGSVHVVASPSSAQVDPKAIARITGVANVSLPNSAHPKMDAQGPVVKVGDRTIGGSQATIIAGPCSVESEEQITRIAESLRRSEVGFLRGGAFKPRTSPYAFQGKGADALGWLRKAADKTQMKVVTEVLSEGDVSIVAELADVMQIGSRNMHNYALLKAVGKAQKPVLLKRSMAATIEEWLLAGEYLLTHGASGVVLCERGIRSFDDSTRNLLDLGAVALLAHVHKLPVIADPSHGTGRRELVLPLAKAALAAGASGVMIETHDAPAQAQSDGAQALSPQAVAELIPFLKGLGR